MYEINTKDQLLNFMTCHWNDINNYLDSKQTEIHVPIYASVDIRESKHKFAPVDHNIYPAGFNNICALDLEASSYIFSKALKKISPNAQTVGIIPESHTKNLFYLDHLAVLGKTIRDAGQSIRYFSFDEEVFSSDPNCQEVKLLSQSNYDITIERAMIKDGHIYISSDQTPIDIAIMNNDQSKPLDVNWHQIKTPIVPTPHIGWFKRKKIDHFKYYQQVANEFCEHFFINPDLIQARFKYVDNVDFMSKEGLDELSKEVDKLFQELPDQVEKKIFIKASQGTYGMGISVVSSAQEVLDMNRKLRNKMDIGKNGKKFTSVVIQEGIDTILKYDNDPAEVAIYLVDGISVGGFMRVNGLKDTLSNLNSKGMVFKKFCISEIRENQDHQAKEATYSVIARLATLASGLEIQDVL